MWNGWTGLGIDELTESCVHGKFFVIYFIAQSEIDFIESGF